MGVTMKMARVGAGMTQQDVADKLGLHVQTYAKMEANPEEVSIKEAKLFAEIVGRDWSDIFFSNNSN